MIYVVRDKPGVQHKVIAPAGYAIMAAVYSASQRLKRDLTVTCGTEDHSQLDPHTLGEALDVSVGGMQDNDIRSLWMSLTQQLGPAFTVLYEVPQTPSNTLTDIAYVNDAASGPHIHIQRRRSTVYPPPEGLAHV